MRTVDYRALEPADLDLVGPWVAMAFGREPDFRTWGETGKVLVAAGRPVAVVRTEPIGMYFGGRLVSAMAISSLVVDPVLRGRGVGKTMIESALAEARRCGSAIAALYPGPIQFYESLGWGIGGWRTQYSTGVDRLDEVARCPARAAGRVDVAAWVASETDRLVACYDKVAPKQTASVNRTTRWWQEYVLRRGMAGPAHQIYGAVSKGETVGYVVYDQTAVGGAGEQYDLACSEFVWTDPESRRSLLGFLARHGVHARRLSWFGSERDVVGDGLGHLAVQIDSRVSWMLRLIDPADALESRGYPAGLVVDLPIGVAEVNGTVSRLDITIRDGVGAVSLGAPSGIGAVGSVGSWASIFAGAISPAEAIRLGRLRCEPGFEPALTAAFGGAAGAPLELF